MNTRARKFMDQMFGGVGLIAVLTLVLSVLILLGPIVTRGLRAFIFYGTVEYRRVMFEQFGRGSRAELEAEIKEIRLLKEPIYRAIAGFEKGILTEPLRDRAQQAYRAYKRMFSFQERRSEEVKKSIEDAFQIKTLFEDALQASEKESALQLIDQLLDQSERRERFAGTPLEDIWLMAGEFRRAVLSLDFSRRDEYHRDLAAFKQAVSELLGPFPDSPVPTLLRDKYGQTRWDRAQEKLHHLLYLEKYRYDENMAARKIEVERKEQFAGTSLEKIFIYFEDTDYMRQILRPRLTFYGRFLTDSPRDAHFFGGIWPELLGTCYLTFGCMLLVIPLGIIAAIYLAEYAKETAFIRLIRTCISTLAAVPSIVFGLFGLAFFINTVHLSSGKSVLVGSATLALLVLPVIIRTSEEAIRAVPNTQKEASLALGVGLWPTILHVILPSAMPGILTGVIIGLGRAAGETAPIIFTAAVSVGSALSPLQTLNSPTPALSWNLYNLCTEHEAVEQIRHVQYGMAFSLVLLVILFNGLAMYLRARLARKLRRT
ncbi:MAG: phosphate ABC transporter permease PstA [bacterium]